MNKLKDLKLKNQLIISTYIMLFILLIFKPTLIPSIYNRLIIAFKPFIIGGLIAFLINIPMKLIEEKIIKEIRAKESVKRHLQNLGFITGEKIEVVSENSSGLILMIKGSKIALNKGMANKIIVQ